MRKYINDWFELSRLPKVSETHILHVNIEENSAWLEAKHKRKTRRKWNWEQQIKNQDVYLSKASFSGSMYEYSSKLLRACGFDVELANWDNRSEI